MCGIAGLFSRTKTPVENAGKRLGAMMAAQAYRGPDQEGQFFSADGRLALGNSRLAIVAPTERVPLPMLTADLRYVIAFNGEIYNYRDQKKKLASNGTRFRTGTDTEVLLEGYASSGFDYLSELEGMWAFGVFDNVAGELHLGRDLMGERQLFYYCDAEEVIFASEAHTVLTAVRGRLSLDTDSAITALRFHTAAPGKTLVQGLRRIRAGHVLTISRSGELTERRVQRLEPDK